MPPRVQSDGKADVSLLAQPLHFEFSGKTAPNRFLKAAMTERLSSWSPTDHHARGIPSPELQNVYKRWGEGGLGHILTGNIMISLDHLEAPGNPIIPPDTPFEGPRFDAFAKLAKLAKAHGSLITGQVSHPGRQVYESLQPNPISASDVQLGGVVMGKTFAKPRAMTMEDIQDITNRFAHAAEFLYKAGYDGIELHGAHGYLLAQFLSQTTNKRTDKYGGSIENRTRIIVEIAQAIRKKVPLETGFLVGIKLNSKEFQEGGISENEAKEVCRILEDNEFDFIELSGGTYQSLAFVHKRESSRKREAFFLEFAEVIVAGLKKTRTYVTGGFQTASGMANALRTVDGVGLARPVCQEFHFAKDILDGKIDGAIEQRVDRDNFGLTNVIAGTQIRQVGQDLFPLDMSRQENVDAFMKDMGAWRQKQEADAAKMNMYGFFDVTSVLLQPYGAVNA